MKPYLLCGSLLVITMSCGINWKEGSTASASLNQPLYLAGQSEGDRYAPQKAVDNTNQSWCEGADGDGVGNSISIETKVIGSIKRIYFKNGYGEPKYYKANNRIRELKLKAGGAEQILLLKDTPDFQAVTLKNPVTAREVDLEIVSVYHGTSYKDTCLSEVAFAYSPCQDFKEPLSIEGSISGLKLILGEGGKVSANGTFNRGTCPYVLASGSWKRTAIGFLIDYRLKEEPGMSEGGGGGPCGDSIVGRPFLVENCAHPGVQKL